MMTPKEQARDLMINMSGNMADPLESAIAQSITEAVAEEHKIAFNEGFGCGEMAEREACAQLSETDHYGDRDSVAIEIAAAIRGRT